MLPLFFNDKLEELSIEANKLETMPQFTNSLKSLDISQNKLVNIDNISEYIEELDISMNKIENLKEENVETGKEIIDDELHATCMKCGKVNLYIGSTDVCISTGKKTPYTYKC